MWHQKVCIVQCFMMPLRELINIHKQRQIIIIAHLLDIQYIYVPIHYASKSGQFECIECSITIITYMECTQILPLYNVVY